MSFLSESARGMQKKTALLCLMLPVVGCTMIPDYHHGKLPV